MNLTFGIVTSAALLDSINPCAISVLLLTLGFFFSLGKSKVEIYKLGISYILALYLTYLFIGLGVLQALSLFGFPNIIVRIGATILAITAITNLLGYVFPAFPKLKISEKSHPILAKYISQATYPSVFILGILVGLFEFPCTGGAYLSILTLLHDQATKTSGLIYLLYYNFVFVLPLLLILGLGSSAFVLEKMDQARKRFRKNVDIVSSILMLILAAIIFANI